MTLQQPILPLRRTRGRPRRAEVQAIDEVVLSAALEEFIAHGYGGASLARIVRNAGISKTTLWSRYPGKTALFRAIMQLQIAKANGTGVLLPRGRTPDLKQGLSANGNHMLASALEGELAAVNRLIAAESARFPELGTASVERTVEGVRQSRRLHSPLHARRSGAVPRSRKHRRHRHRRAAGLVCDRIDRLPACHPAAARGLRQPAGGTAAGSPRQLARPERQSAARRSPSAATSGHSTSLARTWQKYSLT